VWFAINALVALRSYRAVMKKRSGAYTHCAQRSSHFYRAKFILQAFDDQRKIILQIPAMTSVFVYKNQKMGNYHAQ
jgi:hypothetical protein